MPVCRVVAGSLSRSHLADTWCATSRLRAKSSGLEGCASRTRRPGARLPREISVHTTVTVVNHQSGLIVCQSDFATRVTSG